MSSHSLVASIDNVVGEINEKLSETSLGSRIITKNRLKGSISEGFGQALAKCLTSSRVVAKTGRLSAINSLSSSNQKGWIIPKEAANNMLK